MTKDELSNVRENSGKFGQLYNDGFEDGAKFVLQKLQQTPCNTLLLDKLKQMIIDLSNQRTSAGALQISLTW